MSKFWLNEKVLVFASIIILLLFLGLISLFGTWMRMFLGEPEIVCPPVEIAEEKRLELEERVVYLEGLRAELAGIEVGEDGLPAMVADKDDPSCQLTLRDVHLAMGLTHHQLGNYQEAREALYATLAEDPISSFAYSILADNEKRACRYQSARDYLVKAIEFGPDNYGYWESLIDLEEEHLGADFEELHQLYAQGAEAAGTERAFMKYAYFLEDREEYGLAIQAWMALLEVDPSYEERYLPRIEWLEGKIN